MNAVEILQRVGDSLATTATVKSVFGEPIHAEGKTVVPIAKVVCGLGGGSGAGPDGRGEGGGGGGGSRAFPAGALEITAAETRFVPFLDVKPLALAFVIGVFLGAIAGRRRR